MSCCRFPSFPAGSLVTFWNLKSPPAALLLLTNHIVQYQSYSKITKTVSREQSGYYGFLLCTQATFSSKPMGDHVDRVHSDQMVLEMIRWGGWPSRAIAQQRPRKSQNQGYRDRLTTTPTRQQSRQPDGGPMGCVKGLLSQGIYSRGELDNSSKPNRTRAKGSQPEKHFADKIKNFSLFLWVIKEGSCCCR